MDIIIINAVLCLYILYKPKPRVNNLQIFLEYSLAVLCSSKCHLKLLRTRHESVRPVLAYQCPTTRSQQFIYYIYHLTQLGRKSSQIKVKDILYNCLLFSYSKLLAIRAYFRSKYNSIKPIIESLILYVKSIYSVQYALKIA